MTRGLAVVAVVLLVAGCSGDEDATARTVDEGAWRASVESLLRDDDGKITWDGRRQDRMPTSSWTEFAEFWYDVCDMGEDEMRDAVAEWSDTAAHGDMAETNVRYACPDRLDLVTAAR